MAYSWKPEFSALYFYHLIANVPSNSQDRLAGARVGAYLRIGLYSKVLLDILTGKLVT